jgi:hypothetical protein
VQVALPVSVPRLRLAGLSRAQRAAEPARVRQRRAMEAAYEASIHVLAEDERR